MGPIGDVVTQDLMQLLHGRVTRRRREERHRNTIGDEGRAFAVVAIRSFKNRREGGTLPDVASYKIVNPDDIIDVGLERLDDVGLDGLLVLSPSSSSLVTSSFWL